MLIRDILQVCRDFTAQLLPQSLDLSKQCVIDSCIGIEENL